MGLYMVTMNLYRLPIYPNKIISSWLFCCLLYDGMIISKDRNVFYAYGLIVHISCTWTNKFHKKNLKNSHMFFSSYFIC
jgi:hypothetical protein